MIKITSLLAACVALAWASQVNTKQILRRGGRYYLRDDLAFILLVVVVSVFAGLRNDYNDTWTYIKGFRTDGGLGAFFSDPENLNPFRNPLFFFYRSVLREFTSEGQVLIFVSSAFTQFCFMLFFKRYSRNFTFTVFLYFALGTFNVSLGALKQTMAMAILTLGFPCLEQRKLGRFYLFVLIAMLVHTYAISFAILPLFARKPWSAFTFLFIGGVTLVLANFRTVIEEFMEQANSLGKTLESYEVFDSNTVNLFRVAVYMVTPLFSLCFARWINYKSNRIDDTLIHMSIISMAFMLMGTQAGANMFARMAHYFEIGALCCLPGMIEKPFEKYTSRFIAVFAIIGFLGFFVYANRGFDEAYKTIGLMGLF